MRNKAAYASAGDPDEKLQAGREASLLCEPPHVVHLLRVLQGAADACSTTFKGEKKVQTSEKVYVKGEKKSMSS